VFGLQLALKSKLKIKNTRIKTKEMKNILKTITAFTLGAILITSCKKDDKISPEGNSKNDIFAQADHKARPAINTVFIGAADKDKFNTTAPSAMNSIFAPQILAKLNAFGYVKNALGQDGATFTGLLATDVLNASTTAPATTFYDGTNLLTGRALADDVIDVELLLIFGGADFKANPGLTSDNVSANDKTFTSSFPYLATPW
jgi:Domain of unknown function (DUF4331)